MSQADATSALAEMVIGQMEALHDARALLMGLQRMFAANSDPVAHASARLACLADAKIKDVLFALDLATTHALAEEPALDRPLPRAA
jgi:hypothetical protein